MSKRRIAVLIAGMLVGAPIGIASVGGLAPSEPQQAEMPLQAEGADQASTEQAQTEPSATGEQTAAVEQQPAEVGYIVPARPRTLADATFPPLHSDVFPPSTDERPLAPAVVAYLDRKAANTLLADAGSAEPVFAAVDEGWRMSPVQIAYFDAVESARIAAAEDRMRAEVEASSVPSGTATETATATPIEGGVDHVAGNVQQ
jgi:hypothetical protein